MVTFRKFQPKRHRQIALYLLLLILVLVLVGVMKNCSGPSRLAPTEKGFSEGDTLDVAVVYGPGSYALSGDTLTGENYRLLTLLRDSLGMKLRLWPVVSASETLPSLESGQYDILASMPSDNDLKTRVLTTHEVWLDKLVLIQRPAAGNERPITSALDLAKDTVHVEKGSAAERRLHNLMKEIGDTIYIAAEENMGEEYLAMNTATGRFRFAVVNSRMAEAMKNNRYPLLNIDTPVAFTQFQVWAVRRNDTALLKKLNAALDSLVGK